MTVTFRLNGTQRSVDMDPMTRLLDVLRNDFGYTGTKEGCGEGECGACTVLINGNLANSCLVPIGQVDQAEVTTIEGVRDTPAGNIVVDSFAHMHSVQCGFCTPGMVLAALAILREHPNPSEADIRNGISGNICRCTGYDMIVDGVELAAKRGADEGKGFWR